MFFNKREDKSLNLSAPKEKELYGVRIHKLTIGKYAQTLKAVDDIPALLLDGVFPESKNAVDMVKQMFSTDRETMLAIIGRLFITVPTEICSLLSELLDIPKERLLASEGEDVLGLTEISEILVAFAELNDYSTFFTNVHSLKKVFRRKSAPTQNIGFNGG